MRHGLDVTRRSVLHGLIWIGAIALARPVRTLCALGKEGPHDPLAVRLARVFTHAASAAVIGWEYLRVVPREADAALLVDLICSRWPSRRQEFDDLDATRCLELLLLRQRQDFERGRTVTVHGWILSETEARLCALAALGEGNRDRVANRRGRGRLAVERTPDERQA